MQFMVVSHAVHGGVTCSSWCCHMQFMVVSRAVHGGVTCREAVL